MLAVSGRKNPVLEISNYLDRIASQMSHRIRCCYPAIIHLTIATWQQELALGERLWIGTRQCRIPAAIDFGQGRGTAVSLQFFTCFAEQI